MVEEMRRRRGEDARPVIHCVEWKGEYYAIEGSHRLKAAHELGIWPIFLIGRPWRVAGSDEDHWFDGVRLRLPDYSWAVDWTLKDKFVPSAPSTPG